MYYISLSRNFIGRKFSKKMFYNQNLVPKKKLLTLGIVTSLIGSSLCLAIGNYAPKATASGLEIRWGESDNYKRLKYLQESKVRLDRSKYYFFLRPSDRKTAILKLTLKFPKHFKAKIKTKNLSLCKVKIGGYSSKTRCLEDIPATFEVDKSMQNIDIFPNIPIPANKKSYAVVLKMFNPRKSGMYQVNSFSQSPGELPISLYLGSYLIEIGD